MSFSQFVNLYDSWLDSTRLSAADTAGKEMCPAEDKAILCISISEEDEEWEEETDFDLKKLLVESASARRKFRLWEETQGMCIYCGRSISATDFIKGRDSDIEHIIPQAIGGRNMIENKACSCRECNHAKGDLTALDYILSLGSQEIERYFKRLRLLATAGLISKQKYAALTTPKSLLM